MRYLRGKYGGGLYGVEDTPDLLLALEVDWDRDGYFDGSNEGPYISPSGVEIERGREHYIKPDGSGFEHIEPGQMTVILDNNDGRFDPRNTESPLYPYVKPGCYARFGVKSGASGTFYKVFAGRVVAIDPQSNRRGERTVKITVVDGAGFLSTARADIELRSNARATDLIADLLNKVGYPSVWGTNLQTGADIYPYLWVNDQAALDAIFEMGDAELGQFFIAADGKATYQNRWKNPSNVISLTGTDIGKEILLRQPWEVVRNHIKVKAYPKVMSALQDIWDLGTTVFINAGATLTFAGSFESPAVGLLDPVATTDYLLNSAQNGSGTNLTANLRVVAQKYSTSAFFTVTNTGAAGYITLLKIRGYSLTVPSPVETDGSVGDGSAYFRMDTQYLQNVNNLVELTSLLLNILPQDSDYPVIQVEGNIPAQFGLELMDGITLSIASQGISSQSYRVSKIRHQLDTRRLFLTTFWLEPYDKTTGIYWTFPTHIGTESIFTY